MVQPASSAVEIKDLLARFGSVEVEIEGDVPAVLVTHGVQCAEMLAVSHPEDFELQVAGLLHDVGLLLVPGDEEGHPAHGAAYVRTVLGSRVADLVGLHVEAQRYLATVEGEDRLRSRATTSRAEEAALAAVSLMVPSEMRRFEAEPLFREVLALRQADDVSKDHSRRDGDLDFWLDRMRAVASCAAT